MLSISFKRIFIYKVVSHINDVVERTAFFHTYTKKVNQETRSLLAVPRQERPERHHINCVLKYTKQSNVQSNYSKSIPPRISYVSSHHG